MLRDERYHRSHAVRSFGGAGECDFRRHLDVRKTSETAKDNWNAGAVSTKVIANGDVEFQQDGRWKYAGLDEVVNAQRVPWYSIGFGNTRAAFVSNGVTIENACPNIDDGTANTRWRVKLVGNTVRFYRGNAQVCQQTIPAEKRPATVRADVFFGAPNSQIDYVTITDDDATDLAALFGIWSFYTPYSPWSFYTPYSP